jgi:hypothetical protein
MYDVDEKCEHPDCESCILDQFYMLVPSSVCVSQLHDSIVVPLRTPTNLLVWLHPSRGL